MPVSKRPLPVPRQLIARTTSITTLVSDPIGQVTQIAPGRKGRVALFVRSVGGFNAYVSDDPAIVGQLMGFYVFGTPSLILRKKDIGGAIDNAWYAVSETFNPTDYTVTDIYSI